MTFKLSDELSKFFEKFKYTKAKLSSFYMFYDARNKKRIEARSEEDISISNDEIKSILNIKHSQRKN